MMLRNSDLTATDMFCGAGGSSIGAEKAGVRLRMAMNHWKLALNTHETNFPHADHDCTDISATDPRRYPRTDILLASPECTNHSLAKGVKRKGMSQFDAFIPQLEDPAATRSRATMWDVARFAEYHRYEAIIVENVPDIRHWEPYPAWLHAMSCLGYDHREVFLNSMFAHPTPQSRDRIYVVFWKRGNRPVDTEICPTSWCLKCERDIEAIQSWKRPHKQWGKYKQQYVYRCPSCATAVTPYYYAALNAIDWSIPAQRIGDRKRPLRDRTMQRIEYGLNKYGRQPLMITTRYTSGVECRARSLALEPWPTQPGHVSHALLSPYLVDTAFGGRGEVAASAGDAAMPSQTTRQTRALITTMPPAYFAVLHGTSKVHGADDPLAGITAGGGHHGLVVNPAAIMTMRDSRGGYLFNRADSTLMTQVATGIQDFLLQRTPYLVSYYGTDNVRPGYEPMGALSTLDRHAFVEPSNEATVEDCYFRMLVAHECGAGMAFPPQSEYPVLGNGREQVKQYGNAVTPPAMNLLVKRVVDSLS